MAFADDMGTFWTLSVRHEPNPLSGESSSSPQTLNKEYGLLFLSFCPKVSRVKVTSFRDSVKQ